MPNDIGLEPFQILRSTFVQDELNEKSANLIIFLHGWRGDASTFNIFPELVRTDKKMSNYDVATFLHPIFISRRNLSITQVANVLRNQIIRRGANKNYENIYIVSHSLGGVIARKLRIKNRLTENQLPLRGLISLGSPFKGALLGYVGVIGLRGKITENLKSNSQFIQDLNSDWLDTTDFRKQTWWHCFASPADAVVTQESAKTGCGRFSEDYAAHGHIAMAKPTSHVDDRYRRVIETILIDGKL